MATAIIIPTTTPINKVSILEDRKDRWDEEYLGILNSCVEGLAVSEKEETSCWTL